MFIISKQCLLLVNNVYQKEKSQKTLVAGFGTTMYVILGSRNL